MKTSLLLILLALATCSLQAQVVPADHFVPDFCATDQLHRTHPELQKRQNILEKRWQQYQESGRSTEAQFLPFTLPVVVHIIHDNGPENISDAQVVQGIQHLNEAFANEGYYDQGTGVNTQIQFCLATRNPEGYATTGINRVQSPLTEMNADAQDLDLKNLIRWDPLHYINIWLVREICRDNGCNVAGYAYYPSAHGTPYDGIVAEAKWFGNSPAHSGIQIHEMGHYLGLNHTFEGGCVNNNCYYDGDHVCDTPPDQSTAPVFCGDYYNSCDTDTLSGFTADQPDMYWNYMDYGLWSCYSAFTQGQAERMDFFTNYYRYSLFESEGCLPPCLSPLTAGFSPSSDLVDAGTTVFFSNTSTNVTDFQWLINGAPFSSDENASYTFNVPGTFIITLEATNADPYCFSSAQDTIEVVCPVTASFSANNFFPEPGEVVDFTNNTLGGSQFTWKVDGTPQGNASIFSYAFPAQGTHTVCLEAGNGLCTDQFCHTFYVYEKEDGCEAGFMKTIGEQTKPEIAQCMAIDTSGNIILGGRKTGAESLLIMTDPEGNVLWERSLDILPSGKKEQVWKMFIDSEGYLLFSGKEQSSPSPDSAYIAKFDLSTQSLVWQWTWADGPDWPPYFEGLFENPANGNYMGYGGIRTNNKWNNFIAEFDRNTGGPVWQKHIDAGTSGERLYGHFLQNNAVYFSGSQTYASGPKDRPTILKTDLSGNPDWERAYFHPLNQPAFTQGQDILVEGDTIVALAYGSFTTPFDPTDSGAHLFKTDMDGNLLWGKTYTIAGGEELTAIKLHSVPNGYLLQGNYIKYNPSEIFFIRTDKAGNVLWAKGVGKTQQDWASESVMHGNAVYFCGSTNFFDITGLGASDIFFGKIPLEEEAQNDSCSWLYPIDIITTDIQPLYDTLLTIASFNKLYNWESNAVIVESTSTESQAIPDCSCPGTLSCAGTFFKVLHPTGYYPQRGHRIIAEPGGGFIVGGENHDTSSILILLDHEGTFIWERTLKATGLPGEHITSLAIDSDQFLLGVGTASANADTTVNFVFKYDYQNDSVAWVSQLASGRLNAILEKTPGGNYIIAGHYPPAGSMGSECDALLAELDRHSGNLLWAQNYHLDSCESFSNIQIHGNSIYAAGSQTGPGGGTGKKRGAITRLDPDGNEVWSKLYLKDISTDADLHLADLVLDEGIVAAGYGNPEGTAAESNRLQLLKTDTTGNVLWARQYEIPGQHTVLNRLIDLPDGYLCIGTVEASTPDTSVLFLLKTDKNGHVVWSRTYGGIGPATQGYDVLLHGNYLYFTGATSHWQTQGAWDVFFARLSLDGLTTKPCNLIQDLAVVETDITDPYQELHPLTANSPSLLMTPVPSLSFQPIPFIYEEAQLCESPCPDSCYIAPDAWIPQLEGSCKGDSLTVTIEVCNQGYGILYDQTPIAFYDSHPYSAGATLLAVAPLPETLAKDSCLFMTLSLAASANTAIYALVNAEGFSGYNFTECDRENNLKSFSVNYSPPLLDLGPDTVMCGFGVVSLHAQAGFASYQWPDGSAGQNYTAFEPGIHWVVATDSCGGVQRDTMTITVYSSAQSFDKLTVCPGDTAWVFGHPETEPGDYFALFTGFQGCDSLHTLTLTFFDTMKVAVETENACPGQADGSASALATGGTPPYLYDWGEGITPDPSRGSLTSGAHLLSIQDANGCKVDLPFNIGEYDPVSINLPPELTLHIGESELLAPEIDPPAGIFLYSWDPPEGLSCTDCPNPTVQPNSTTTYLLIITDTLGCIAQAQIVVNVDTTRRAFIPNLFSPNGDSVNDLFTVFGGPELLRIRSLHIYDRWGENVFQAFDLAPNVPEAGWDGNFKGRSLPPGVYVYKTELEFADGKQILYLGNVTLVR